ncbi:uncharacterized protein LOC124270833 isoform X1 [Haliotis rubra]|uniref:uncharacterized protein LOC124270833 isoform X1 n=1 Tax=Haliotis rubra TaxID=36100 RepID=UPI001EE4FD0B|nr:uncharacterized protein LOC124270833 isoform X1 [Haliotis rubra]
MSSRKSKSSKQEKALEKYYFNAQNPGAYFGPSKLRDELKKNKQHKIKLRKVKRFVNNQDAYTLHKPVKHKFKRLKVRVNSINEMFDVDLTDLSRFSKENDGIRYLLVAIDILSRYAFVLPLTNKKPESVFKAFKEILNTSQPKKVRTDDGSEFKAEFHSFLKRKNITHTIAHNENIKSNYVERFNRTLKSLITRYMTHNNTKRYLDVLPNLVNNYNHTQHSSLPELSPAQVNKTNELKVWQHLYVKPFMNQLKNLHSRKKFKYKVGDIVRIPYLKRAFSKELDLKWTQELFKVAQRFKRQEIPLYKIKDFHDEIIKGIFYTGELQKVDKDEDIQWQVEKVLKKKRMNGKTYVLVRWLGWPSSFDSYVEESQLKDM